MNAPEPEGRSRRPSVTSTIPSEELSGLDLAQLRDYRQRLAAEEDRVSYWRRLTHARMDMLRAEAGTQGHLSFEDLVRVLGDTGTGQVRRALVRVTTADPLPDLPELSQMWVTDVDPHDPGQVDDALERLRTAEEQLTEYRRALHERIDDSTRELIARYREDPPAALTLLPPP